MSDAKKLRALEDETSRLKIMLPDVVRYNAALKDLATKITDSGRDAQGLIGCDGPARPV